MNAIQTTPGFVSSPKVTAKRLTWAGSPRYQVYLDVHGPDGTVYPAAFCVDCDTEGTNSWMALANTDGSDAYLESSLTNDEMQAIEDQATLAVRSAIAAGVLVLA